MKPKTLSLREMWELYKLSQDKNFSADKYAYILFGKHKPSIEEFPGKVLTALVHNHMDDFQDFIEGLKREHRN